MTGEVIPITVDHRERNSLVPQALLRLSEFEVSFDSLEVGDYRVSERLLFERKTLSDFCASIRDGRLFRQARHLAKSEIPQCLILEGTAKELAASRMSRQSVQGALISVSLTFGIPVLRSFDSEETARLMLYSARQTWGISRQGHPRPGRPNRNRRKAQLFILQSFPQVGPVRALSLLEAFGSVQAVCCASSDELRRIRGIGEHTANFIRWVVEPASVQSVPGRFGSSGGGRSDPLTHRETRK